jgi:nucleoside-diphosphate-sugar epimerase
VTEIENVGGYDVASFEYTSILDVAKIIAEITGAEVVSGSLSDSVQSGHQFDPSPEILSWWRPQVSLRDGINKVLTEIAL